MTLPSHHPGEEWLLAYAAGTAPEAASLVIATHLALCPTCRATCDELDALGGALVDELPRGSVDDAALAALMARLEEPVAAPPRPAVASDGVLPEPLRSYVGPFDQIRWQAVMPGGRQVLLPVHWNEMQVRLSCVKGGFFVPAHDHLGPELHLVLTGGYTDHGQHFERGDLQVGDVGTLHRLHVDRGQDCVSLIVNSRRMAPRGVLARMFAAITGL